MSPTKVRSESLFNFTVGGRTVPVVTAPNCLTCRSRFRRRVETLLVEGKPPSAIIEALPGCSLNRRNIREHLKRGHLPLNEEIGRRLLGERAEKYGAEVTRQVDALISMRGLVEQVMQRAIDGVQTGELTPTTRDGLKAAKFLHEVDQERRMIERWRKSSNEHAQAATDLIALAEDFMTPEAWSAYLKAITKADLGHFIVPRGHSDR